jgi:glycosyltransferase involved in cell wall biosynthesis
MKIAYFIPYIAKSGPVSVVYSLAQRLSREHEIDIFYFKDINRFDFLLPTKRISLFEYIDFDKYDILHSHGVVPDSYLWWHSSSITRAKSITTLHNYVKEDSRYRYGPIKAHLLPKVWNLVTSKHDGVVTLSKDAIEYYRKFWYNKNLFYVYNGIPKDVERDIEYIDIDESEVKIGAIGSSDTSRVKGFDQAIRAIAKLSNCTLYIAGDGREIEELREMAEDLGVEDRVNFVGFQDDISSFVDSMDMFIVPSRSDGFPLALQEIVRGKRVVVCSDIPIFREIFDSSEVVYFKLDDIDDLVDGIERAISSSIELSTRAYRRFLDSYTVESMSMNYLNIYKNITRLV